MALAVVSLREAIHADQQKTAAHGGTGRRKSIEEGSAVQQAGQRVNSHHRLKRLLRLRKLGIGYSVRVT